MNQSTILTTRTSTPRASLAALGIKLQRLNLFGPIRDQVHIPQNTVRHSPADKLYDALIAILARGEVPAGEHRLAGARHAVTIIQCHALRSDGAWTCQQVHQGAEDTEHSDDLCEAAAIRRPIHTETPFLACDAGCVPMQAILEQHGDCAQPSSGV